MSRQNDRSGAPRRRYAAAVPFVGLAGALGGQLDDDARIIGALNRGEGLADTGVGDGRGEQRRQDAASLKEGPSAAVLASGSGSRS
ncbi:MAG: hypothetical protein JWM19_367 [Actinomycetia bacterium]|nr:hypothetical protein [Actinomycetes bacterium]